MRFAYNFECPEMPQVFFRKSDVIFHRHQLKYIVNDIANATSLPLIVVLVGQSRIR